MECEIMEDSRLPEQGVITMVELQSRNKRRYNIYINDEYAFSVHEDTMLKYQLFKGADIDAAGIESILQAEERNSAYIRALGLLARRPHGERELRRKLEVSGSGTDAIDHAVERLTTEGYIDDNAFAKQFTEQRVAFNRKGRLFIRQELQQKGIGKEDIAEAIESVDPKAEYDAALHLAKRKWASTSGTPIDKSRKTVAFLMRRGFPQQVAMQSMREAANGESDCSEDV
jgi:regulatory protein